MEETEKYRLERLRDELDTLDDKLNSGRYEGIELIEIKKRIDVVRIEERKTESDRLLRSNLKHKTTLIKVSNDGKTGTVVVKGSNVEDETSIDTTDFGGSGVVSPWLGETEVIVNLVRSLESVDIRGVYPEDLINLRQRIIVNKKSGFVSFKRMTKSRLSSNYTRVLRPTVVSSSGVTSYEYVKRTDANSDAIDQVKVLVKSIADHANTLARAPTLDLEADSETVTDRIDGLYLSSEEKRELRGVVNPTDTIIKTSRLVSLGIMTRDYETKYSDVERIIEEDKSGKTPTSSKNLENLEIRKEALREAKEIIQEEVSSHLVEEQQVEDVRNLQKVKEWLKENLLGVSALGIVVATLITTIVISARGAAYKGGRALGKLGKAVANLAKQAGPLLASLLGVVATVLKWGAYGVSWLASNLWVLVIALVLFAYDQYNKR